MKELHRVASYPGGSLRRKSSITNKGASQDAKRESQRRNSAVGYEFSTPTRGQSSLRSRPLSASLTASGGSRVFEDFVVLPNFNESDADDSDDEEAIRKSKVRV